MFWRIRGFEDVRTIKGVALSGEETSVIDDAAQFFFVGAATDAGSIDHVFFDEDAANIVGAELQTDLAHFNARC